MKIKAVGVRYLMEQIPTLSVYNGSGVGDMSPSQAISDAAYKYTINDYTDYQWLPCIGAVYRAGICARMCFTPHTGLRYAVSLHTQPVPAYCITNLNFAYHQPLRHVGEFTARLQFLNLFNRHYIGLISQNYVQTGANAATFYPGAPLTVVGSLALRF